MAVINRTPDSFYDRGATFELDRVIGAALTAASEGADWVDVGGVPFGRGPVVTVAEEIARVVPVVEGIAAASDVVISVDTNNAEVARAAIGAGAAVINDTSGLGDPDMAAVIAESSAYRRDHPQRRAAPWRSLLRTFDDVRWRPGLPARSGRSRAAGGGAGRADHRRSRTRPGQEHTALA